MGRSTSTFYAWWANCARLCMTAPWEGIESQGRQDQDTVRYHRNCKQWNFRRIETIVKKGSS